ncbi:MAG: response regulator transcription factor [Flavobacteriales bacterium]|nr:response regulator transcription factor [Flavobacteriales bacterium]
MDKQTGPRIGLVDDHAVVRRGIRVLLRDAIPGAEVTEGDDLRSAQAMVLDRPLDLLVLDMHLPDGLAMDLLPKVLVARPGLRVLVFSVSPDEVYAHRLAQLGAWGYVNKQAEEDELVRAVQAVLDGRHWFSGQVLERLERSEGADQGKDPFDLLSVRELSVLNHLLDGLPLAEIARRLDLQHSTVATYKARLLDKLGVRNVLELQEKARVFGRIRS